jgi:hypothetical protein
VIFFMLVQQSCFAWGDHQIPKRDWLSDSCSVHPRGEEDFVTRRNACSKHGAAMCTVRGARCTVQHDGKESAERG